MIDIDKIEDAWIADIKANIGGVKTVAVHEAPFDMKAIQAILALSPFILIRYGGLLPVEGAKTSSGRSGLNRLTFFVSVGAHELRDPKIGQRGCYSMLKALRDRYDGKSLITAAGPVYLSLESEDLIESNQGLIVYGAVYSTFQ